MRILSHLFYPQESNNHRPKILHLSSLFTAVFLIVVSTFILSFTRNTYPYVLGASADIAFEELLILTNQKRAEINLEPLKLDDLLSQAASMKASDMFEKDYWAHNSPDGTTPWVFIKKAGYDYVYAGENLARGFSNASDVVNAWMASKDHRENMLSVNFEDVGFAVEGGELNGEDTVLVVEVLGGKKVISAGGTPQTLSTQTDQKDKSSQIVQLDLKKSFDSIFFTSNFIKIVLGIFIATLILDLIVIERKKIVRFTGHSLDHVIFLTIVLVSILVLSRGIVL